MTVERVFVEGEDVGYLEGDKFMYNSLDQLRAYPIRYKFQFNQTIII